MKKSVKELTSDKFRVAVNTNISGMYKDNDIYLIPGDVSRILDPGKEELGLIVQNIEIGALNIVDKDGVILLSTGGIPKFNVNTTHITTAPKISDDEKEFVSKLCISSVANITAKIETITDINILKNILVTIESEKIVRKTAVNAVKERIAKVENK